ncbi:MAG TPA: hypoxanthine phosphoribosyltransferase [Cytophagales bacterium]|nr:hypoxanthine phosphoribosyltransferase [Cytophagales bacterium]HCR54895.1 hypoxanthine phosphoribosyltransferase [Cytophagales bacterium]
MKIKDIEFRKFIASDKIAEKVALLAAQIDEDYKGRSPLFLPILNGSFMFAADLTRKIKIPCRVSFVKHSSMQGVVSSGHLKTLIGLQESLFNQDLILIEDVMDTGLTLTKVVEELQSLGTKSVEIVTLFRKAKARDQAVQPKYVGFEIEDEFILGYGLDYEGWGRNFPDLYKQVGPMPASSD